MDSSTLLSGSFAGRYKIERELGHGSTSTVYLATDVDTSHAVALKVLRRELAESVAADRFLREIRLNQGLEHSNVIPVLDSGEYEGDLFLVLPLMEGGSLRQRLEYERQLSLESALDVVRSLASALDHAHREGLIHRDVKPENILFSGGKTYLADFGIARAILRASGDTTTEAGIVRGTPGYMSPEQASGDRNYDGRSDQYSLACVVYEMLAGVPAFHGPTPEATIAMRFRHPPRELNVYRATVPAAVEPVLRKAMSLVPADRYTTVGEFAAALEAAVKTPPAVEVSTATTAATASRLASRRRAWVLAAAGACVAVVAVVGVTRNWFRASDVVGDTTQIAVFPFDASAAPGLGPAPHEQLHAALRRWQDVHVVPLDQTLDAVQRRGSARLSPEDFRKLATSLGAGRYVVGKVVRTPTGYALNAEYRDARSGSIHAAQLDLPADSLRVSSVYAALADSLVLRGASDGGPPGTTGPRHLFATQAFIRAANARNQWDLTRADSEISIAVSLDPEFSRGYLWQAQQKSWEALDSQRWISLAERALIDSTTLTPPERLMARALVSLGRGQYPEACGIYKTLIRADSMNFAGWYGLGECNQKDHVVVPDSRSASGWRFRSSIQQAVVSYVRAFQLIPATYRGFAKNGFNRLGDLLFISGNRWTEGTSLETPARAFWGVPALSGDTIELVPRLKAEVTGQRVSNIAPTAVLIRLRSVFDTVVTRWAGAFPRNADVKEALAISLEIRGEPAAIDTMEAAERLVTDRRERVRLAASRLAIQIKFAAAASDEAAVARVRESADSLLVDQPIMPETAGLLAPLAAMTGRCALTSTLLRQTAPATGAEGAPRDVLADIDSLEAYVSVGCHPTDVRRRLDGIASRLVPPQPTEASRWSTEYWQLNRIVRAVVPLDSIWVARLAESGGRTLVAERDLLEGRLDSARAHLRDAARARQRTVLPGQVTADAVVPEARVWLMLGDTAAAVASVESALNTARQATPLSTDDPRYNTARLGFLMQAYALHAVLLARTDRLRARQSGRVAATMWLNADPELKQTVARLREILK